jgi:tetratricopeptide (TPR) repeat protein
VGNVNELMGRYDDAIDEYEAAIAINPNLAFIYLDLGRNYRYYHRQRNHHGIKRGSATCQHCCAAATRACASVPSDPALAPNRPGGHGPSHALAG